MQGQQEHGPHFQLRNQVPIKHTQWLEIRNPWRLEEDTGGGNKRLSGVPFVFDTWPLPLLPSEVVEQLAFLSGGSSKWALWGQACVLKRET
jgi:hypothetical protein